MSERADGSVRRLAAIWFADIVGYTRLSSTDENSALLLVTILQQIAREHVTAHGGRVVKFIGDAVLADFSSTDSALRAALALRDHFQEASTVAGAPSKLRIGIHVGDVLGTADGDLYGDSVNLASRVQGAADPGQVAVTQDVWHQLRQRRDFRFESVGERNLKGLDAVWMFNAALASAQDPPVAPPPAVPPASVRYARIVRLALVYGVSALILLQVTGWLSNRYGLGGWVTPTGLVLLLVGFVVMVATGWVQTRSPWQRSVDEPTDPWKVDVGDLASSVKRHRFPTLTWGRALAGGALAFSLLFGGAGAYVLLQDGGLQNLDFAPRAAEAQPHSGVAILPFAATGADSILSGEDLVELLALNLGEVAGVRVADPRAVISQWRDAGQGGDSTTAVRLAAAVDSRYAVSGTVEVTAGQLTITADIYDAETGVKLGTRSVSGPSGSPLQLLDQLALEILQGGIAPDVEAPAFDLGRLATSSMPALHAYLDGTREFRRLRWPEAQEKFGEAVQADPTFAQAHYGLSLSAGWASTQHTLREDPSVLAALRNASDLPPRDQMLIRGYAQLASRDAAAVSTLEQLTSSYPDFVEGWFLLGDAYYHQNNPRFRTALDSALALDPTFGPAYVHLLQDAQQRNDLVALQRLTTGYLAVDPSSPLRQALDHLLEQAAAAAPQPAAPTSSVPAADAPLRAEYDVAKRAADAAASSAAAAGATADVPAFARGDSLRSAALLASLAGDYRSAVQTVEQAKVAYDRSRTDMVWELRIDSALVSIDGLEARARLSSDEAGQVESLRRQANDARAAGRYSDALRSLGAVAERYRSAAAAPTQAEAPPTTSRGEVPPPQPPPAADPQPRGASAEEIAEQVMGELEDAMEKKDIAAVRGVWTSLSDQGAQGLQQIFRDMRTLTYRIETLSVARNGDRIAVRMRTTMQGHSDRTRREEQQQSPEGTFQLGQVNGRWVIVGGP